MYDIRGKKNKKGANSLITKKNNNTKRKKEIRKGKGRKGKVQPSTSNYRKIEVEIII